MRKQFCAYTKGITGGAALRNRLIHAGSIEEYRTILDFIDDRLRISVKK
jgi:hypothetical protein